MAYVFKHEGRMGFRRDDEISLFPLPDGAIVIEVDFYSNQALLNELENGGAGLDIVGGVLTKDGQPYPINADTGLYALIRAAQSLNGQNITALSNNDFRRLVALITYKIGWMNTDGTLRIRR